LRDYRSAHGEYPSYLVDLPADKGSRKTGDPPVDYWGHPIYFEVRNEKYLLLSFGRDGRPDGLDYWRLREQNDQRWSGVPVGYKWDADQVMSGLGFHRVCGK